MASSLSLAKRASTLVAKQKIHFSLKKQLQCRSMGGGPMMPPFARLRPPTEKLPEDIELVWDDSVAPETCIDFDAPHWPLSKVVKSMAISLGFLVSCYYFISWTDPVASNPVATRAAIISHADVLENLGLKGGASEEEDENEDED